MAVDGMVVVLRPALTEVAVVTSFEVVNTSVAEVTVITSFWVVKSALAVVTVATSFELAEIVLVVELAGNSVVVIKFASAFVLLSTGMFELLMVGSSEVFSLVIVIV